MTNFERLKNGTEEQVASAIAMLMAEAAVNEEDREDWNLLALHRDRYKAWLLRSWLKIDHSSPSEDNI